MVHSIILKTLPFNSICECNTLTRLKKVCRNYHSRETIIYVGAKGTIVPHKRIQKGKGRRETGDSETKINICFALLPMLSSTPAAPIPMLSYQKNAFLLPKPGNRLDMAQAMHELSDQLCYGTSKSNSQLSNSYCPQTKLLVYNSEYCMFRSNLLVVSIPRHLHTRPISIPISIPTYLPGSLFYFP